MTRPRRDDRGVAALELGIFSTVLLLVTFAALPLYAMMRSSQKVSKASAATLRYATAVASNGRRTGETLSRRPTYDDIRTFARDSTGDADLDVVVTVCKGVTCTAIDKDTAEADRQQPIPAAAGDLVKLTVRTTVDLSLLGRVANATSRITGNGLKYPENDMSIQSTASAREE
jgi:Flp pilus assembly protein TadG